MTDKNVNRWRLILGQEVEEKTSGISGGGLTEEEMLMDQALAAIYSSDDGGNASYKGAGLGKSAPALAKWLVDVKNIFPKDIVTVIEKDAIELKGLKQLLFEPEMLDEVSPNLQMASTLLLLKEQIPQKSKDSARMYIRKIVNEITKNLENKMVKSITGALNKKNHSPIPHLPSMDWKRTITKNLKNYDVQSKRLIPEKFYFYERNQSRKDWTIILDIDQSGSMMDSIIYSSVMGSIFASIPSINSRVVVFDTEVVDLTETCANDPVEMLFGINLGGGTDINKSVKYCRKFIERPDKTIFILISDLYEGGVESKLLEQLEAMKSQGVVCITLLALSDSGIPSYDKQLAKKIANLGIPSFACSPEKLPDLIGSILKGDDIMQYNGDYLKEE